MTAANGDRITVQRVTQTVAGEYREWTVTVRRSSPAGVGDPLHAFQVELPVEVRDALIAWLETPVARNVTVGGGSPLLVGREFTVGPRVRGEERAPLFPIEPEPAAPYAGRTAPRRTRLQEVPIRLWNREHTDHLDVTGWAHRTRSFNDGSDQIRTDTFDSVRIRLADKHADIARVWLTAQDYLADGGGHVFVAWLDREWTLAVYSFSDGPATIDLLPLPKPPRVDQVLGRADRAVSGAGRVCTGCADPACDGPWCPSIADLNAMKGRIVKGYEETRGLDKTRCPGCTNPTEHGHYPWCPHALDEATAVHCGALNPHRQPDKPLRCERAQGHQGSHNAVDVEASGGRIIVWDAGPVGTVTSGLIHAEPEPMPEQCEARHRDFICERDSGHTGPHSDFASGRKVTWTDDVDVVLPMPGGPNDRLSQAVTRCGEVHFTGVRCMRPAGHNLRSGGATPHRSPGGGLLWGDPVVPATKRRGYADLYARLDAIHDATNEEES